MVPSKDELLSNVHITPVRASRALSLRYLANRFGLDMDGVAVSLQGACCLKACTTSAWESIVELDILLLAIADYCQMVFTAYVALDCC